MATAQPHAKAASSTTGWYVMMNGSKIPTPLSRYACCAPVPLPGSAVAGGTS